MSKVSIIIITHNRLNYLGRILDYYRDSENDFQIIVADSSSEENKIKNKEIISSFLDLNILYLNHYSENITPRQQVAEASSHVESKYCLLCNDDDFITPDGIRQSLDFLENNPDFTVAHGYYASFYLKTKKNGRKQFCLAPAPSFESITFPEPQLRLIKHLSEYSMVTGFGVYRADFFKMIFGEMLKFTNDERFGELLPSMLALIYGKMKRLDLLYAVREIGFNTASVRNKTIRDFIKEGSYDGKYNNFKNCLAIHLSKNSQLNTEESKKIIDEAMSDYLKKIYPDDFKHFLINKMKDVLDYLPDELSEKIKLLYIKTKLNFSRPRNIFLNLDDPSSKYYEDFNKIRDCVMSHIKT